MKKKLVLLLILVASFAYAQNEISKIIVVRHAEKENDGSKDPSLSEIGKTRAEKLNKMLADVKIDRIYSTPYSRTIETIQPIANDRSIKITAYNPVDKKFSKNLVSNKKGKTVLIVGHSNTCPDLVNSLLNINKYEDLDENDFGKIWILTYKNDDLIDCFLLNY